MGRPAQIARARAEKVRVSANWCLGNGDGRGPVAKFGLPRTANGKYGRLQTEVAKNASEPFDRSLETHRCGADQTPIWKNLSGVGAHRPSAQLRKKCVHTILAAYGFRQ